MSDGPVPGYVRDARPGEWPERLQPEGYHLVAVDELARCATNWRLAEPGRRCRYTVGPNLATCKRPAVVELNRSHKSDRAYWYGYCDDPAHLYGRLWEAGRLLMAILVKDRP